MCGAFNSGVKLSCGHNWDSAQENSLEVCASSHRGTPNSGAYSFRPTMDERRGEVGRYGSDYGQRSYSLGERAVLFRAGGFRRRELQLGPVNFFSDVVEFVGMVTRSQTTKSYAFDQDGLGSCGRVITRARDLLHDAALGIDLCSVDDVPRYGAEEIYIFHLGRPISSPAPWPRNISPCRCSVVEQLRDLFRFETLQYGCGTTRFG